MYMCVCMLLCVCIGKSRNKGAREMRFKNCILNDCSYSDVSKYLLTPDRELVKAQGKSSTQVQHSESTHLFGSLTEAW